MIKTPLIYIKGDKTLKASEFETQTGIKLCNLMQMDQNWMNNRKVIAI